MIEGQAPNEVSVREANCVGEASLLAARLFATGHSELNAEQAS